MAIISETSDAGVNSRVFPSEERRSDGPIASYRPAIPQPYWEKVRPFVLNIMNDAEPLLSKDDALQTMSVLTRFGLWVWQSAGLELTREVVFRNELIEECFSHLFASLTSNTLSTYRSRLRMLQRVLRELDDGDVRLNSRPFKGASALPPYSEKELVAFRSWARGQNTHSKRRDAQLLLALGAGAGLTTEDLVRLKTDDVLIDEDGVLLEVKGRRARKVPVLREWEALIVDAVQDIGLGRPLFGVQRTSYNNNSLSAGRLSDISVIIQR